MTEATWIRIADAKDCPLGSVGEYVAGGRMIALFHTGDGFFALDGICPHQGGPLGQGELKGCVVACPWHGWEFDVRSGVHQSVDTIQQPGIPVKEENGGVFVRVEIRDTVD